MENVGHEQIAPLKNVNKLSETENIDSRNIDSMVTSGIGIKLFIGAGKSLLALIFVVILEPMMNWIILQIDTVALLSDKTKLWLDDIKLILVVITAFFVLIKVR